MLSSLRHAIAIMFPTNIRLFVRRLQFYGTKQHCSLCNSSVSRFWDFGVPFDIVSERQVVGAMPIPRDICPVCWGASRARLIALYLELAEKRHNKEIKILHIAPDIGVYYWIRKRKKFNYIACDLNPSRYTIVPNVKKADITSLPFPDSSFDYVICSHVLEHVPHDLTAMREILRVLCVGGSGLLMVPEAIIGDETDEDVTLIDPRLREERFGQDDHIRLYSRKDFIIRLEKTGFDVVGFDGFSENFEKSTTLRLNPLERLWVARKVDKL